MKKRTCSKCGFCCWHHEVIPLSAGEVKSGRFKTRINPNFPKEFAVSVKNMYIPELGKKKKVCCYYIADENLCSIHGGKPSACRKFFCKRNE